MLTVSIGEKNDNRGMKKAKKIVKTKTNLEKITIYRKKNSISQQIFDLKSMIKQSKSNWLIREEVKKNEIVYITHKFEL